MGRTVGKRSAGPSQTVAVSMRLDPRIHFGLTLLARKRCTTLTGVVEWAAARAIADALEGLIERRGNRSVNILDETWDTDEADRFVKLAQGFPSLLRFEEDRLWKAIRENPELWTEKSGARIRDIRDRWPALRAHYLEGEG